MDHEQRKPAVVADLPVYEVLRMFAKILVAVSASSADTVLASAIEAARKYDAQIVALHVVDPTPCYLGPADCNFDLIVEAMKAHGRKVVAHVRNVLDSQAHTAEVHMATLPMSGMTMGRAIAIAADETGAELILLGERRRMPKYLCNGKRSTRLAQDENPATTGMA
ncbi:universal stress protein [Paraburkholderia fungorum]|uniref:universal stress protein n=1 Tax=Paraburkholderia fungorum TaxID=134537 RepID=UPI0038BD89D9